MRLRKEAFALAAAALVLGAAAAGGCSLVTDYDGFAEPCGKSIPTQPSGGGGGNKVLVGMTSFLRFIPESGTSLGYNLDKRCTGKDLGSCRGKGGNRSPGD